MNPVVDAILATRLVGIIRMKRYEYPREVAEALIAGGIRVLEYTLSGEGALQAITAAREASGPGAFIGAGTVLSPSAVEAAASAGAQFIVTPAVNVHVIAACQKLGLPMVCGAFTPTEITVALEAGAELIKLFPARIGGPQYVRDLLAPLPDLRLVPTGGVSLENAATYLAAGAVAVAMGGNLVSADDVSRRQFQEITHRAEACLRAVAQTGG